MGEIRMTSAERRRANDYALEKLGSAVEVLVTLDAKVTTRVARAAERLLTINSKALPPELGKRLDKLMAELSKYPGLRSAFYLRGVHGKTGSRYASTIYSIECQLQRHLERRGPR